MIKAHTIQTLKKYGVWSFSDKEYGIDNLTFCNGADILLNHYAQDANRAYIMFATEEFPEQDVKELVLVETVGDRYYYNIKMLEAGEVFVFRLSFNKELLKYFPEAPEKIYFKIIRENENQEPDSVRSSSSSEGFA